MLKYIVKIEPIISHSLRLLKIYAKFLLDFKRFFIGSIR